MAKTKRIIISYIGLGIALIIAVIICILAGSVNIDFSEIFVDETVSNSIVFDIRMPRMIAAIFAGGALSIAGYCLQSFFHNPIAGPYLLGISSGAKLSVAIALIIFAGRVSILNSITMVCFSFIGAMISMGFVLLVSRHVKSMSMLLVCGVMIGYICTAICDLLIAFADDSDIVNLHNWSRGSLSGITMLQSVFMSIVVIISVIFVFSLSKAMSAFLVSENYARSVGVNITAFKIMLVLASSLLSATVTAFAGPISFVGIAVPHLIRKLLKTETPLYIIPACFLGGAVFTCICDVISRTLFAPTELSISTITAVFGSPVVIYMLTKKQKA